MDQFRQIISSPYTLEVWAGLVVVCVGIVLYDLLTKNTGIMSLMKLVWTLTVLYSGPLGLAIYWTTGRKWIKRDSLWRRGWRSDAHCYSGCGAGEIIGVLIVGWFTSSNLVTALVTFSFAYIIGFSLTVGPLMQSGETMKNAIRDAFWGETVSITCMEIAAIGIDLWVAGQATIGDRLFWASLVLSLTVGLLVAYPANLALIHFGVKEGMMNPRET